MKKTIILIRNAKSYDFGGGERFPVFLASLLQSNGYKPLIVSRSKKLLNFADTYSLDTVKGWWWSHQNWSGKLVLLFPVYIVWQFFLFLWYFQLFLRKHPSVIHIQSKDDFIAATFAGKLLGARVVWTDHADLKHIWMNLGVWYKNPVGKFIYRAAKIADVLTVVSKSEYSLIREHLGPTNPLLSKITVVYNGVVDKKVPMASRDASIVTFCVASRLVTDKGIGEVIEAFLRLEKTHPKCKLLLLGDGREMDKFKKLAGKQTKIHFMGHQKDPLHYIADADIFVHPTYHEGFSVALVEAGMLARPIIATSVGGNVEIIDGTTTGLLVKPQDVTSLYEAMLCLFENTDLREKLGKNARKQYEKRFDFAHIVRDEFIPLYEGDPTT
jgi:glycosyltransferase involved in cell wall biosynthesis